MKNKKRIINICVYTLLLVVIFSSVSYVKALGNGFDYNVVPQDGTPAFEEQTNKIWNTFMTVARIAAFAGIFLVGVRYMVSNSDQRAEIKKSSIALIIGMVLVFTTTLVIDVVVKIFNEIRM